jgi:hypothetical protein
MHIRQRNGFYDNVFIQGAVVHYRTKVGFRFRYQKYWTGIWRNGISDDALVSAGAKYSY